MAVGELHAEEQKMTRKEVSLFTWLHNHVLHVEDQVRASDTKPTMSLLPAGVQPRYIAITAANWTFYPSILIHCAGTRGILLGPI